MNIPITETGKRVQNYVFNYADFLGAGNFSKCYKGYNELTNEVVAIKIVELNSLKSKKLEELLFQEIEILKKLNHPSVLKCFQIFTSNRNCYIITQLCNQGNLENKLKFSKVLEEPEANPIIKDVYDGLLYLAQNNIVHRDLKSANIFLHNGRAKIADFGFAKEISHNFKDLNIGSPLYMAPEGILHNIYGPKTQVWAMGILVYELFHGSSPYIYCKTQDQLRRSVTIPLNWKQLRQDLSQDIKEFILTCLQINEQKRATIQQLANLGYIRRLHQPSLSYQTSSFDIRSPSKSVHMLPYNETDNQLEPKERINNNFRPHNNFVQRDTSRGRQMQRQDVFRSVDMRAVNQSRNNKALFHSPHKKPTIIGGLGRFDNKSPGVQRTEMMINSVRPISSSNQPIFPNVKQPMVNYQPQQILNGNCNYQFRMYQQPVENVILIQKNDNLILNPKEMIQADGALQNPGRPLSSYNQQQRSFDAIGYNSMNGFFQFNNQMEPNENNLTQPPSNSQHQRKPSADMNENTQKSNQGYFFAHQINFKQAIFFIHHCRLIFKFLCLYKEYINFDQQSYIIAFRYLMSVLTELNRHAQNNGVVADGQKAGLKIKKFKEVNLEYLAKYRKQLEDNNYTIIPEPTTPNTLSQVTLAFRQLLNRLNEDISLSGRKVSSNPGQQAIIVLAHLCIIIIASLREISQALQNKSFSKLLQFKQIQTVLNTPKDQFTLSSYKNYKDKYLA